MRYCMQAIRARRRPPGARRSRAAAPDDLVLVGRRRRRRRRLVGVRVCAVCVRAVLCDAARAKDSRLGGRAQRGEPCCRKDVEAQGLLIRRTARHRERTHTVSGASARRMRDLAKACAVGHADAAWAVAQGQHAESARAGCAGASRGCMRAAERRGACGDALRARCHAPGTTPHVERRAQPPSNPCSGGRGCQTRGCVDLCLGLEGWPRVDDRERI